MTIKFCFYLFLEVDLDLTEYHAKKMRRVQRKVDNLRKSLLENKKMDEKEVTFFERKRLQIMQNMEVTVENLHISYETSSTTKLGHSFSFGFTLHYLKLIVYYIFRSIYRKNSFIFFRHRLIILSKNDQKI